MDQYQQDHAFHILQGLDMEYFEDQLQEYDRDTIACLSSMSVKAQLDSISEYG
jgi:hypothetical protein